ncbi:MAG TPA: sialidase family protein [Pyrinomonadaceae bacterium]
MKAWRHGARVVLLSALLFAPQRLPAQTPSSPPVPAKTAGALAAEPLRVSAAGADAAEPALAADRAGRVFVVWVEHDARGGADVSVARYEPVRGRLSAPVRVNPRAGAATAWRGDPPTLAFAPDGALHVGWTARVGKTGHATDLYVSTSRDGGRTFAPPVRVNDDPKPVDRGLHSLAVAPDGRIHVAWLDDRNAPAPEVKTEGHHEEPNRELFAAYSTDGGRTFTANRRVAADVCPCCKTALAVAPGGRVYVGWRQVLPGEFRHIAVAASADGGRTFAPYVVVSDDRWQLDGCPVSGPALAVTEDGAALNVLWYAAGTLGEPGLYRSETRDGGRTYAPRSVVSAGRARGTPLLLASASGALFAVWESTAGGAARPVALPLDGAQSTARSLSTNGGQLPAAVLQGARLFVAYVADAGGRRGVWLAAG